MAKTLELLGVYLLSFAIWQVLAATQIDIIEENRIEKYAASRILSGWEASPGQHPWQLALRLTSAWGSVLGCGGVLVHASWGLTAAHCTSGRVTIVVRAGLTNLTTPVYMSETTEFYNHPSYDASRPGEAQPNDIAILRLTQPVPETEYTVPIRMQPWQDEFRDYSDDVVFTSGFGRLSTTGASVENLHWVFLRVVSNAQCWQHYGDVITYGSICAGPYNVTSQSVCYGDSGGPLVHVDESGAPSLIGITSFVMGGDFGCHSGFPGAFTRPGPHHEWFTNVTGINFDTLEEEITSTRTEPTENPTTITATNPTTVATANPTTAAPEENKNDEDDDQSSSEENYDDQAGYVLRRSLKLVVKAKVKMNNNFA